MNFKELILYKKYSRKNPKIISEPNKIFKDKIKILFLRQDRLGDVLISIPFFKEIRQKFPLAEIHILLGEKNKFSEILIKAYFQKIYIYEKKINSILKLIGNLRDENYDLIIDLFDNASRTSSIILNLIKSPNKLGFEKKNSKIYDFVVPMPDKSLVHPAERLFQLLLPFGINPKMVEQKISLTLPENSDDELKIKAERKLLGIVISGSTEAKSWGKENIIEFIKQFKQKNIQFDVVIFSTFSNQEIQNEICEETQAIPAPIRKSFIDFAKMVSQCDFILTPDTSVVHLCSAFQIPSIILYYVPEIPPKLIPWTPYKSKHIAILTTKSVNKISTKEVLEAFEQINHY